MSRLLLLVAALLGSRALSCAADAAPATPPAAAPATKVTTGATDLLERFVTWLHGFFPGIDDTLFHWIACGVLFLLAILLRNIITHVIFFYLKKLAAKTETTLDDKLFPALESPCATLVMVLGIFAALTVLQVSDPVDRLIGKGSTIAVLGVILWGFIRAGGAVLDHLEEIAHERQMTVATFMPLIKKTLFVVTCIIGLIMIADSLGARIGALLTSLGIGGLAFALAAQDTIANLFGSLVVVMDQPFKVGDTVKVGANTGTVEDIGLRSTKIRLLDKSLVVIPNKSVASEAITNLTRFTGRRVEQVLGLTYDTRPDQMETIVAELRQIITAEAEIDTSSVQVFFRDFGASSMDIWLVYVVKAPDFAASMKLRQRLNLAFMRAVEARGLAFAFPTQTVVFDGPVAKQIAEKK
jgi:MscS family membrane protein